MSLKENRKKTRVKKPRIVLTSRDLKHLFEIYGTETVTVIAKQTGLPYLQIYNIVHQRVASVSDRHYRILFRQAPPSQNPLKVDGAAFRAMVQLWLYCHNGVTRSDLYKELFEGQSSRSVDHRIFSGKTAKVDARLEQIMRQKFSSQGVDRQLLEQWLEEFEALPHSNWIPYSRVRPALVYLEQTLGVHPTSILNQSVVRYESGELRRVPRSIASRVEAMKQASEMALRMDESPSLERIRESIIGGRPGYTLYSEIREELRFLIKFTRKGTKHYLGRSTWTYEHGNAKRIPEWRAKKILKACDDVIRQKPTLLISDLPSSRQQTQTHRLVDLLKVRTAQMLDETDSMAFEKRILRPSRAIDEYKDPGHGFTPFEMAPRGLGMKRKAFDLMVARHCDIFRSVGKYANRWYLPELYLKEISSRKEFGLLTAKYERLAKNPRRNRQPNACLN